MLHHLVQCTYWFDENGFGAIY